MNTTTSHSPIFVTGIERSGSSIVAKIIAACGVFIGDVTPMQENTAIKILIDNYYKYQLHIPINGQNPLPNTRCLPEFLNLEVSIYTLLRDQGYNELQSCLLKGFRFAQTWPIWDKTYPNAKWIIVRRRTGDIIQSCLKTGFMNAYSDQIGWLGWIHEHEKLFVEMIEKGLNCKIVWPERMVNGDFQQMQETIEWLGLQWDDSIKEKIQPLLKNSTNKT